MLNKKKKIQICRSASSLSSRLKKKMHWMQFLQEQHLKKLPSSHQKIFCIELKISLVFVAWYTIHQTSNFQTLGSLLLDTYYKACHSVSKLHFLFKNYKSLKSLKNGQLLFLSQNWLFLAVKIRNRFEFSRLNWSKIVI